jgi:cephalosporin hydroxylase
MGHLRPTAIVEAGSASGGSALWFAAQARGLGLTCRVLSVDIDPVTSAPALPPERSPQDAAGTHPRTVIGGGMGPGS